MSEWRKANGWAPNRLRHAFATRIRREFGIEAAQVTLGHSRLDMSEHYAEKNEAAAVAIAAKSG